MMKVDMSTDSQDRGLHGEGVILYFFDIGGSAV